MRIIKLIILGVIALALVLFALANRTMVEIATVPDAMLTLPLVGDLAITVTVPLFLVLFGGVAIGVIIGYIWEWLREYKHRAAVTRKEREKRELEREVKRLKGEKHQGKDDVLALIDNA
ncbi:MAG: lipopolysaccharide assembly protein LapA domain-containing protein [Shimia sp.]